jgi:hypothetical protein
VLTTAFARSTSPGCTGRTGDNFMCGPIAMSDDVDPICGMFIESAIATRCCATSHVLPHGEAPVAARDDALMAPRTHSATAIDAIDMTTGLMAFSIPSPPLVYTLDSMRAMKSRLQSDERVEKSLKKISNQSAEYDARPTLEEGPH